jgi:Fur family ferric uptake transcriptional regulator
MLHKMTKENKLKHKKLRVTDFRLAVLGIFEQFDNAITLTQIEENLAQFDRITLYRTIKVFKEKGLVHDIVLPGDVKKMALCEDDCDADHHEHQHIHFLCRICQEVYCVDLVEFPSIGLDGFRVDSIDIQASGTCAKCA